MEQWWWSGGAKDGDLENGAPQPFFAAELSLPMNQRLDRLDPIMQPGVCVCVFAQYEYLVFGGNFGVT